jgi:hypothetical protein
MNESYVVSSQLNLSGEILHMLEDFLKNFMPLEISSGTKLLLHFDKKSQAYYFICHLDGQTLVAKSDLEASLDNDVEDEIYKLNRDITEDKAAYKLMEQDASAGRSFEDLVIEYDNSYREDKPLKIYGGQHRIQAIKNTLSNSGSSFHGIRVYFNLSREQKVEIATINNTSITVPNDLIDRMREQLLGTELRDWCQEVGLLDSGEDFSDKRSHIVPTVRIARTLIVNYYSGFDSPDGKFHQPIVCKSGGMDEDYDRVRGRANWSDAALLEMGKQFSRLHQLQRTRINEREQDSNAEYARKALSLSVVGSWAYAAGLFQRNPEYLGFHYSIPDSVSPPSDPLNAKALSEARLKGVDKDTYRGLGTRSDSNELGRMLEIFIVLATRSPIKRITKPLANAAIQSYEAKKATYLADKALGKL